MDVSARYRIISIKTVVLCLLLCGPLLSVHAGIRGRGKYSGVVIFDRWDTCFLLSGHYIMYIARDQKERLRSYIGQAIQINATDVIQPINPGDGLIRNFTILGPAPDDPRDPLPDGLRIEVSRDISAQAAPSFVITARNFGTHKIKIDGSQFGPTVLGSNRNILFSPSDGASVAWITRISLDQPGPGRWIETNGKYHYFATYVIGPICHLTGQLELQPGQSASCRVSFKMSPGSYQFMVGYGGGVHASTSIVSNAISFHIDK